MFALEGHIKMKVAMISTWKVRCGIASYTENLANALGQQDVEVFIVRLPRFGFKNPQIIQNVAEHVPFQEVDLVHVQHEYGLYQGFELALYNVLKAANKPIVTTMHAVGNWDIDNIIKKFSNHIIVHNKFCFKRFNYPLMFKNTSIIPHGASPTVATPNKEAKEALSLKPNWKVVGYLGFVSSYKGLETLIETMIKVKNAGLLIGGGWHKGDQTDYINRLKEVTLKVLPNRCQWLGFVEDSKLATVYGAMDILVYPSLYATESGALITALSYGKAVIANALPPFKEKEKEGALITFRSITDLQHKIKKLLADDHLRLKLEEGAKAYAEKTSWINVASKHVELYSSLTPSKEQSI